MSFKTLSCSPVFLVHPLCLRCHSGHLDGNGCCGLDLEFLLLILVTHHPWFLAILASLQRWPVFTKFDINSHTNAKSSFSSLNSQDEYKYNYNYKHKIIIIVFLTAVMGYVGPSTQIVQFLGKPGCKLDFVAKEFNFESSC